MEYSANSKEKIDPHYFHKIFLNIYFNFGRVDENSKYYDIRDEVGKKILDYRLVKIKCQLK